MSVKVVEGIIGAIQKRIDEYEEMATDLAHDYIQSDKPFPTDLKQRYNSISEISEGLIEAIGIIMQGDYKQDDEIKRLQDELAKAKEFADYKLQYSNQLLKQTGELIDENKCLRKALLLISLTECLDGKDRHYYQESCINAISIAEQALKDEQYEPSTD